MEEDVYNVGYVGVEGLLDRVVIEVADSFRKNLRAWCKHVKKNEMTKAHINADNMWEDLAWFLSGYLDDMYPTEDIDGRIFFNGLFEEWTDKQLELGCFVDIPAYVESMEVWYNEFKESDK